MLADLHCHPATWSYQKLRNSRHDITPRNSEWHIWNVSRTRKDERKIKKGKRASYAQSDFKLLSKGDVRLVFASLYPMEKGFFMGNRAKGINANVVGGLLNNFLLDLPDWLRKGLSIVLKPVSVVATILVNNEGQVRDFLQKMVMKMHKARINFFQSNPYDYYDELKLEYAFYNSFKKIAPVGNEAPEIRQYDIAITGQQIDNIIAANQVAVVLTMEGFHSVALKYKDGSDDFLELVPEEELKRRVKQLKDWGLFFVTFSHHFSNHLVGHAHSLPLILMEIANPEPLMNKGFECNMPGISREYGKKWIRELLSISEANVKDPALGRRVLIDVKHMSAVSRKEYYETILKPYNKNNPDTIPVIASHCGYYGPGGESLDLVISKAGAEKDDSFHTKGFYQWNINLCDEDIEVITESGGLIGVSLDQRILGEKPNAKSTEAEYWVMAITRNIIGMVQGAKNRGMTNPENVWNCFTIGSDYDGLIDPANTFPRAEELQQFEAGLLKYLTENEIIKKILPDIFLAGNPYTPVQAVEKICFKNAYDFTLTHFK
jgi:microsomal dipeptidase-like Zn-dependent dipeptidase